MPKVIIVDDEPVNLLVLRTMLEALGAEVHGAAGGREGLTLLKTQPCDVLLADIHMPQMGGLEMVRRLRAEAGPNQDVVVIAVTADTLLGTCELRREGFDGLVHKPISLEQIRAALAARRSSAPARRPLRQLR